MNGALQLIIIIPSDPQLEAKSKYQKKFNKINK